MTAQNDSSKRNETLSKTLNDTLPRPGQPGDLFVCRETADFAVQWLIVEEPSPGRVSFVPVDAHPIIGPGDVAVADVEYGSELVARCGHTSDSSLDLFQAHLRSGEVDREALKRVRTAIERHAAAGLPAENEDRALAEIEASPEYEDWITESILPALGRLGNASASRPAPEDRVERELDFAEHTNRGAARAAARAVSTDRSSYPSLRAAAILAIGVALGLLAGLWLFSNGGTDRRPTSTTEANIPVFLLANAETERTGNSTPKLPFPEGHESMTIALSAIDSHLHDRYRIEVYSLADSGREPLTLDGLVPDGQGLLTLRLTDHERWRGGALFKLFAASEQASEPLASYRLEFE